MQKVNPNLLENLKDERVSFRHSDEQASPRLKSHHSSQNKPWLDLDTSVSGPQPEVGTHLLQALSTANTTLPGVSSTEQVLFLCSKSSV